MTLQSGNKSHTKLFPLHWSCLARTLPQRHAPPSPLQHHRRRFQLRLQLRLRLRGQHSTLSCAQIQNPNPNPFSINDAPNLGPRPSDRRLAAVFRAAPFSLSSLSCRTLGSLSAIAAYDSSGPPFCWLMARTARLCCTFYTNLFIYFFFILTISVSCLWAECAFSVASAYTHTHAQTHAQTHTHTHIRTILLNCWQISKCPKLSIWCLNLWSTSNCNKFDGNLRNMLNAKVICKSICQWINTLKCCFFFYVVPYVMGGRGHILCF